MPQTQPPALPGKQIRFGLGVTLTAVAGYVDAVGYLALGGLFASFMSGASVSLGASVTVNEWGAVYEAARLISVFLAGTIAATVAAGVTVVWALPIVLALEGVLLAAAALLAWKGWNVSIAILPVVAAMGIQNTALKPMDGVRLGVTFMTGTIVSLGQGIGDALLGRRNARRWFPHAFLWCAFCAGAAAGAFVYVTYGFLGVFAPAALVIAMAIFVTFLVLHAQRRRKSVA